MSTEFNPSSFTAQWAENGNLEVAIQGADPDGIQTVAWHYGGTGKGTNGTVNAQFAEPDGTAHVVVDARHFPGEQGGYSVTASQTLGPPQVPAAAAGTA